MKEERLVKRRVVPVVILTDSDTPVYVLNGNTKYHAVR